MRLASTAPDQKKSGVVHWRDSAAEVKTWLLSAIQVLPLPITARTSSVPVTARRLTFNCEPIIGSRFTSPSSSAVKTMICVRMTALSSAAGKADHASSRPAAG